MSMNWMCPLEPAWGDVATWLSGIASFAAVATALYLARHADKPKAKGSLSIVFVTPDVHTDLLAFSAYNLGTHSLRIGSCFVDFRWPARLFIKPRAAIAINWSHPINSPLPADIGRGEAFNYCTSGEPFKDFLGQTDLPAWLLVRLLRAGLSTPWGAIHLKIDRRVRNALRKQVLEYREEHPDWWQRAQ